MKTLSLEKMEKVEGGWFMAALWWMTEQHAAWMHDTMTCAMYLESQGMTEDLFSICAHSDYYAVR